MLLVGARLWLTRGQSLLAIGDSPGDDRLYVELAAQLVRGHWLGPYHYLTLAKNPLYPMWIAATFAAGVPLLFAQQFLYSTACIVLARAVAPALPGRGWTWAVFLSVFLNPASYADQIMTRAAREGIYPALALLVLGASAAVTLRLKGSRARLTAWAALLGASLAALWLCREEGIWVLPLLTVTALVSLDRPYPLQRAARSAGLAFGLCAVLVGCVLAVNWSHYGVPVLSEQTGGAFPAAYGAVSRVRHERWRRFVPVPKDVREKIYAVSPSLAELRPRLEGPDRGAWVAPGCSFVGVCDEVYSGLFFWQMRDAAMHLGYARSGREFAKFWKRVAREVNAACDDKRLDCFSERSSLIPPWHSEYMGLLLDSIRRGALFITRFDGVSVWPSPSTPPIPLLDVFRDLTRERLAGFDAQRKVLRFSGWAAAAGGDPVEIQLLAPQGTPASISLERSPRPDTTDWLRSRGMLPASPGNVGFVAHGYCPDGCTLVAFAKGKELLREPITQAGVIDRGVLVLAIDEVAPDGLLKAQERVDRLRLRTLEAILCAFRKLTLPASLVALAAWLAAGVLALRRRRGFRPWLLASAALAGFSTRLLLVGFVDAMAFIGINVQYLAATYSMLLAFVPLAFASLAVQLRRQTASA
jgi:hypothetical protein